MPNRLLSLFAILVAAAAPGAETPNWPIAPRTVTLEEPHGKLGDVLARVTKQTGIAVVFPPAAKTETCEILLTSPTPFWQALEDVADRTGHRIVTRDQGRTIALEPRGKCKEVSSVAGPFRTVVRQVVARGLLDLGQTTYEVRLDSHWEPRFPVFRIDSEPTITRAVDDRGTNLTAPGVKARNHPGGSTHAMSARLHGLTRDSRKIAVLAGDYGVTASPELLPFRFADLSAKLPVAGELPAETAARNKGQVAATLTRFQLDPDANAWEARLELRYPPGGPTFESFESWLTENQLRLISPAGKAIQPDDYEIPASGRNVVAVYRFNAKGLGDPTGKGWSLVYDTPAPLIEFRVPFELKDIPLP